MKKLLYSSLFIVFLIKFMFLVRCCMSPNSPNVDISVRFTMNELKNRILLINLEMRVVEELCPQWFAGQCLAYIRKFLLDNVFLHK